LRLLLYNIYSIFPPPCAAQRLISFGRGRFGALFWEGHSLAVRNIITLGDETLRKKSRRIEKFDARTLTLLDDLAETLHSTQDGVGLAAVQVGVLRRAVVVDVGEGLVTLVNPEITASEGEQEVVEGCLSVPGRSGRLLRPEKVTVSALDRDGKPFEITGEGLLAKCLCHEIDHLDGILFIDKLIDKQPLDEE
jgi:peptide deformylase